MKKSEGAKKSVQDVSDVDFISTQVDSSKYFFGDIGLKDAPALRVICAGRERCETNYTINRKDFIYYAIEYIPEGNWDFFCDGKKYHLKSNSLFAYEPKTSFSIISRNKTPTKKYFIDFIGKDTLRTISECGLKFGVPITIMQVKWIHELWEQLLNCDSFAKNAGGDIATLILKTILRIIREDIAISDFSSFKASYATFAKCRAHINENFMDITSAAQISDACHVQESYICRLFKKYENTTPMALVTDLKIHYATDLLLRKKYSVKEASEELGFQDQYHFSRVFKKVMGLSPKKFVESVCSKSE